MSRNVRRRRRRRGNGAVILLAAVIVLAVLCLLAAAAFVVTDMVSRLSSRPDDDIDDPVSGEILDNKDPISTDAPAVTTAAPGETAKPAETTAAPSGSYTNVTVKNTDIHIGDLILVNGENEYKFPEKSGNIAIYGNKNTNYKVSNSSLELRRDVLSKLNDMMSEFAKESGKTDLMVSNAYRSYETQSEMFEASVNKNGLETASKYLAKPGFSEHHTGTCFDLKVYTDGISYTLDEAEGYDALTDICTKYGFILRFPASKAHITGISYDKWHFRYVGAPHAEIMAEENICLEEYIDFLKKYQYMGSHLTYTDDAGTGYEIYYVKAGVGDTTEVPVPEDASYTISGNNVDGFVVTVSSK